MILFGLLSVVFALFLSSFGRYSVPITSGDWAQHMALVETDVHNALLSQGGQLWDAGFMAGYPGWSHVLVAYPAAALDIDPLRSMQMWTAILLIAGCFVMAVRLVFQAKGPPSFFGAGVTAVFLATCAYSGFGLRGHILGNYFFPQLAGTVVAIAALAALELVEWNITLASLMVVLMGGVVLPNFHLIPAIWFTFAALIIFCLTSGNWRLTSLQCAFIAITNLSLWRAGAGQTVSNSNVNGWFLIRFAQLSDHGTALAMGLGIVFCALLVAVIHYLRRTPLAVSRTRLARFAGLISICLLICLQAFAYLVLHIGSVYAVTKYLYLLGTELAVLLAGVRWITSPRIDGFLPKGSPQVTIGCFVVLFVAQGPFLSTPYDQKPLMGLRERLRALPATFLGQRNYPQFSSLDYDRKYYLAIAVLRIPEDDRTVRWVNRGGTGETPFEWPDPSLVPIPNSDFESGSFTPWLPYLSAEPRVTGDKAHGGRFALAEASGDGSVYQDIAGLMPDTEYTFSAFVSGDSEGTATAQLVVWDVVAGGPSPQSPLVAPGPVWQPVSQSIRVGAGGIIRLHLLRHSGKGAIYWDDARLVVRH